MATVTVTPIRTFTSGETVTPTKLNELSQPNVAVSAIQTADISDAQITTAKIADANVTTAKLAAVTQDALLPAGAVMPFAMNSAPAGWLAADGTAVSRATYATLFAAVGTTYGAGDGSTTFALPNLQGIFVRGSGSQTISGITYSSVGITGLQLDAFQGHRHSRTITNANLYGGGGGIFFGGVGGNFGPADVTITDPTTDGTNGTPRTASETRPANIVLLYCIKF